MSVTIPALYNFTQAADLLTDKTGLRWTADMVATVARVKSIAPRCRGREKLLTLAEIHRIGNLADPDGAAAPKREPLRSRDRVARMF